MTLLPLAQTLLPLPASLIPTARPAPWVDAAPPHLRLAHPPARAPPLRPAQASAAPPARAGAAPPPRPDRRAHGAADLSARLPLTSCCGSDGDAIRRRGTLPTAKPLRRPLPHPAPRHQLLLPALRGRRNPNHAHASRAAAAARCVLRPRPHAQECSKLSQNYIIYIT